MVSNKMDDKNKYSIYIHINKINRKVYIGQTSQHPPEKRWLNGKGYSGNKHFDAAIKKYGWNNFEHKILYNNLSINEANDLEAFLINQYNSTNNKYGYNIKPGGRNSPHSEQTNKLISQSKMGHIVTDETKRKISENHADCSGKNNPRYGKHCSEETKQKIRENNRGNEQKGVKRSIETIQKMIENHPDFSGYNNPKARSVNQYSLDGKFIKQYSTLKEAGESIGQKGNSICICCKNNNRTAGGYKWKYADKDIRGN